MYVSTYTTTEFTLTIGELKELIVKAKEENLVNEMCAMEEILEEYSIDCMEPEDKIDNEDKIYIDDETISGELATFFNENSDVREW